MEKLLVYVLLLLLAGCSTVTRLNPGECVVLVDRESVTTAGADCKLQRISR